MRKHETPEERMLWAMLRGRRFEGFKFRRQVPIGDYIADFLCPSAKLIVEIDGSQHAESEGDRVRDAWLKGQGFRVVRIWNNQFRENRAGVGDIIFHALMSGSNPSSGASRHLLPQGEKVLTARSGSPNG